MLTIVLNGVRRSFEGLVDGADVAALVAALGLKGDRVAVELEGEIVRREGWESAKVKEEAKVEVVHFVGGGADCASGG